MTQTVLIVGGGRVGRHVAEHLSSRHNTVTIIERNAEKCSQVASRVTNVIEGDGTDPAVLAVDSPDEVNVVAGLTNDTKTNLTVCKLGREAYPGAKTILRIAHDGEQDYGYLEFVDSVVYPAAAGAAEAAMQMSA